MKIQVITLAVYDGRGLYSLAFPSMDEACKYVIDYFDQAEASMPADGESIDKWLDAIACEYGIELALDEDVIEVPV